MSYYFQIMDQDFHIEPEKLKGAHEALLKFAENNVEAYVRYHPCTNEEIEATCESWMKSPERLMFDLGYSIEDFTGNGGIDYIHLEHEKYCDEDRIIFETIAPFVADGSFVQYMGEDGYMWRYTFKNGKCIEQYPEIKWVDQ